MAPGKKVLGGKNKPPRPPPASPNPAAAPCLTRTGKTTTPASLEMPEDEDMDLSSVRARNIMRNNQFATQLGVRRLAELFQISAKRVAGKSIGKKSKASLLGKDVGNSMSPSGDCVKGGAGRTSKRVLAPENPEEMRCTRLRAARQIKFDINTDSSPVKAACEDILKGGVRQMRYRLKKKYFDGVPANQVRTTSPLKHMSDEEWRQLVDMWSSPEHKDKCAKNQLNHEKVKYQQRTGSRSYIAQAYIVKQEKYKDSEPTAIDLFEEFHCSKTKGFSEPVKKAIDDMHAQEALTSPSVEDGQQAKTSIEAISKVLPKSNTFLRNVEIQQPAAKTTNVVKDLQTELDAKKLESARLQQELERLKAQAQESDAKVDKQAEEIASLRKMAAENQSLLRQMIAFGQSQIAPP